MFAFIKHYKRTLIVIGVVLLLLFIAFTGFAFYAARTLFSSDIATPTLTQYRDWVGLWLPDDTQNFQAYGEGWQDWLIEARFELSASAFTKFVARNNLEKVASQNLTESSYGLEWFTSTVRLEAYSLKALPESAVSTSTGFYPTIWVDDTTPDKTIVFIRANDT
jgi:hypothetical protein